MSTNWKQESLEFIFEYIKEAPEKQVQTADALDTKMVQIFGAASIIIGLAGLSSVSLSTERWVILPLIGALLAYIAVAVVTFVHLGPKAMRRNLHADVLWPDYGEYEVQDIKEILVQDTRDAYAFNKGVLFDKATMISRALIGTALEVIFVGIAVAIPLMKAWFTS